MVRWVGVNKYELVCADCKSSDLSIPLPANLDGNARATQGTTEDLLSSARSERGKSLNGLDFPLISGSPPDAACSSDLKAWEMTMGGPFCHKDPFPLTATRWGLAATSGSHHGWHIDCQGLATYIDPKTGGKLWIVARPRDRDTFASTEYLVKNLNSGSVDWDAEGVLLKPGCRL